jgi:CDP-6-deoxy-D-xylo-4-hexulose-3-dehydrase
MMVHVLGYCSNVQKIRNICKKKKIILIEDTCESLGSKFNNKYLGTFGDFGTYSFYYSHQITCGEGGMVVCNSFSDYKLLYSLRAHGWARGPNQIKKNSVILKKLDSRFIFINSGFNLRPTDIAASIASSQLKRLDYFIKIRNKNRNQIIKKITLSKKWKNQFIFLDSVKNLKPSWFGLPILLNQKFQRVKKIFTEYLEKKGVENRPIISGNFLNQPSAKLYKLNNKNFKFPNADEVQNRGFFIGLHTKPISKKQLNLLEDTLFSIDKFVK